MSSLERLRDAISAEGEPIATALRAAPIGAGGPGQIAASGPRAAADPDEYELLVEAIYEGYLLHYADSRLLETTDRNLALLAGDRLYALGLERLVALGDLEAVRELADVISLCALMSARGEGESCRALWFAGARAVGFGDGEAYRHAKALLRIGDPAGTAALAALTEPHAVA